MVPEAYKDIVEGLGGGVWVVGKNMKELLMQTLLV